MSSDQLTSLEMQSNNNIETPATHTRTPPLKIFTIGGKKLIMIANMVVPAYAFTGVCHITLINGTLKITRDTTLPCSTSSTGFTAEYYECKLNTKVTMEQILEFVQNYQMSEQQPEAVSTSGRKCTIY